MGHEADPVSYFKHPFFPYNAKKKPLLLISAALLNPAQRRDTLSIRAHLDTVAPPVALPTVRLAPIVQVHHVCVRAEGRPDTQHAQTRQKSGHEVAEHLDEGRAGSSVASD